MANRYPLIIDTADGNKIKELPADDNLYLRNNSIEEVQDINALGTINAAAINIAGQPLVAQGFTDLLDTPDNYLNSADSFVKVNSTGTGLIFADVNNLGNITVDNLTVNTGNILPLADGQSQIGLINQRFWKVHSQNLYGSLRGFDGTLVFDAATNRISYSAIFGAPTALSEFTNDMGFLDAAGVESALNEAIASGDFNTNLKGSVFGEDSSLIVDGINNQIYTEKIIYGDETVVSFQDNTSCSPTVDTVIFTSSSQYKHAIRLFVMAQGRTDTSAVWETQACDVVAVRGYTNDEISVSVYGLTYSSAAPLATFDGRWNSITNRIEITCQPTSATYLVQVSVHALEMESND